MAEHMDPTGAPPAADHGAGGSPITGRLVVGLVLVALGLLWTLDNLGLMQADSVLRFWPVLLMGVGLAKMTGVGARRAPVAGGIFTIVGSWLLLHELGVVRQGFWSLWPLFLIVLGSSIVYRSMRGPTGATASDDAEAVPRPFAFMGGVTRRVQSQQLRGAEANAVMGGVELDLRQARAAGPTVTVDVFAWWGGIEILVPDDWRVVSEAVPIMGAVEESTSPIEGSGGTTLIVRGVVVMGGVEIRHKRAASGPSKYRVGVMIGESGKRSDEKD